jgi:hypothetical protein
MTMRSVSVLRLNAFDYSWRSMTHAIVGIVIFVFLLIAAPVLLLYSHQLELLDLVLVCLAVLAGLGTWMLSREK